MSFIHLPSIPGWRSQPRHSFNKLRSFHLSPDVSIPRSPAETLVGSPSPSPASPSFPTSLPDKVESQEADSIVEPPKDEEKSKKKNPRGLSINVLTRVDSDGMASVPAVFWLGLAILVSIIFVLAMACTFSGVRAKEDHFKPILDNVAATNPGVVLLGENVDIDVDEPSITIRWSIIACGEDHVLPGSVGIHGSSSCGLPVQALNIYVDGETTPTATYNPTDIPFDRKSGERRSIENLVQFDSDHVLDVHEDYLYPFDHYQLSSTLRATTLTNESVVITKLATISETSSFLVDTTDVESYSSLTADNSTQIPSRDIDMRVKRPSSARGVALLLFAVSWFLTHICIGHVVMSRKTADLKIVIKNLISSGVILAGIPQLRGSMPDAPGFDGVLIDTIGYFPQMVISGLCVVLLLLIMVARELDGAQNGSIALLPTPPQTPTKSARKPSYSVNFRKIGSTLFPKPKARPPPPPSPQSANNRESFVYDKHRMTKHLQGQFVFPPVQNPFRDPPSPKRLTTANLTSPTHRRFRTELPKVQERSERGSLESIDWDFRDRNFESPLPPKF